MKQPTASKVVAYGAAASMVILSLSSLLAAAQTGRGARGAAPRVVEAQEFRIRSADGRLLASLHAKDDQPTLSMYGADGKPRLILSVETEGTAAVLLGDRSDRAKPYATLMVLKDRSAAFSLSAAGSVIAATGEGLSPNIEAYDGSRRLLFQAVRAK